MLLLATQNYFFKMYINPTNVGQRDNVPNNMYENLPSSQLHVIQIQENIYLIKKYPKVFFVISKENNLNKCFSSFI